MWISYASIGWTHQPPALVSFRVVIPPPPVHSTPTPMIVPDESRFEPELPSSVPEFHATESLPCSASSSTVAESTPGPVKTPCFPIWSRKTPQRLMYTSFKEERA